MASPSPAAVNPLPQPQADLSDNTKIPFTAKMIAGIFIITLVAGPIILVLGASGVFGLVGSTGFCGSVAVGGSSVLITAWIIRNVFITYKEAKAQQESATDASSLQNVRYRALTSAAEILNPSFQGGMTVEQFRSMFFEAHLEERPFPQSENSSSTPTIGRFYRALLLQRYNEVVKGNAPLHQLELDELMHLSYVISLLATMELKIKKEQGQPDTHDQSTYYDLFRCARTYHHLKSRFAWKDPSDFYKKDYVAYQWKVLYNHLCECIGSVVEADKMKEFGFLPLLQKDLEVDLLQACDKDL